MLSKNLSLGSLGIAGLEKFAKKEE